MRARRQLVGAQTNSIEEYQTVPRSHGSMASSSFVLLPLTAATSACLPLNKGTTAPSSSSTTRRGRRLACKATAGDDDDGQLVRRIDRRDVLLGLTGVGAAATSSNLGLALATGLLPRPEDCVSVPITAEVLQCASENGYKCAPSAMYESKDVIDFSRLLEEQTSTVRVRRPAHLNKEAIEDYKKAIGMMKALDDSDPRSFKNQAAIHEAYCAAHYKVMEPGKEPNKYPAFDVHYSSIFAPWHRMYIYFFERILGDLIGKSDFGLPYWNWDAPEGMMLPPMFADPNSSLYDESRDPKHVRAFMDFNLGPTGKFLPSDVKKCRDDDIACLKENNLCSLYRQMNVHTPQEFHGRQFCKVFGKDQRTAFGGSGSLENGTHTAAHIWLGDPGKERRDMGDLSTAALDPVFYCNHSNVDRMWHIWIKVLNNEDLPYKKWQNTSFVFYDEKKRPVSVKVSDVLDICKLGYTYEDQPLLWREYRPTPSPDLVRTLDAEVQPKSAIITQGRAKRSTTTEPSIPVVSFPITLKKGENEYVTVARPEKARADGGSSKKAPEVLVVDLTIDPCETVKFDVLVNVPKGQEGKVRPRNSEFAGSFTHVLHGRRGGGGAMEMQDVSYQFALREIIEDLKCGRDGKLDITLIPVAGEKVVVNDLRVELL